MTGPARPSVPVVPVGREAAGAPAAALYACVITHSRITPLTGAHYAETLRLWRERFTAHRSVVTGLGFGFGFGFGFGTVFQRMGEFYLAYSEGGFRSGYLDVRRLLLTEGTRP